MQFVIVYVWVSLGFLFVCLNGMDDTPSVTVVIIYLAAIEFAFQNQENSLIYHQY